MSSKSLNEHVGHAERLSEAFHKLAERAGYLADSLAGPLPEDAPANKVMFAPAGPGLIGALGANLDMAERECIRVAAALTRIGEAINTRSEKDTASSSEGF
jgi:hypothetical protein